MARGVCRRFVLVPVALFVVCTSAYASDITSSVQYPDGKRHFIVLVDANSSMTGESSPFNPISEKRIALASAEKEVEDLLLTPGRFGKTTWFRPGKDYLTVVHYGVGLQPSSLETGQMRQPDELYVRRAVWANTWISRKRLSAAMQPKIRTYSNASSLAQNVALASANVPGLKVQETYLLILSDSAGDTEGRPFSTQEGLSRLSAYARNKVQEKKGLVEKSLTLEGTSDSSGKWLGRTFGKVPDAVSLRVLRALPRTTSAKVASIQRSNPVLDENVEEASQGLKVNLLVPPELIGLSAFLTLHSKGRVVSKACVLSRSNSVLLGNIPGNTALSTLTVATTVSNPILGKQFIRVQFQREVTMPAGRRMQMALKRLGGLVVVFALILWSYFRLAAKVRFCLWLPGYVTSFSLPPLQNNATSDFMLRMPTGNEELAAVVTLPPLFVRLLFCRHAFLHWDVKLKCPGMPEVYKAKLTELPTVVKLVWQERPFSGGNFDVTIERARALGRNQHAKIHVRFLALPHSDSKSLENP